MKLYYQPPGGRKSKPSFKVGGHINLRSAHAPASPLGFSSALQAAPGMEAPSVLSLSYVYLQVCPTKPPQESHMKNHKNTGVDSVGKSARRESTHWHRFSDTHKKLGMICLTPVLRSRSRQTPGAH